ncbi:acyltransferase [Phenylobacterium sp. LjRoot225]|uniref:acyltransferase family protein n=1 Tax=Phenylobacterium sp. LjRoot225 TaxID=3342285 RepID=UPI003ECDF5DB
MIWSLQTLRFVAALLVVYVHSAQVAFAVTGSNGLLPHDLTIVGRAGVDIFFVISGVVIAKTAPGLTWDAFAWKRLRRIIPIYFLACIPALAIAAKAGFGWREVVATFLLWPATDVMTMPMLPVAWTLCFEALFYAAATLVILDRRWMFALLGLYAAATALRSAGPVFQFLGNPIILEFLMGVGLAYAPACRIGRWGVPAGFAALVAAGFLGVAPTGGDLQFLQGEGAFQRVLAYGLPSALIVYGAMQIQAKASVWTYLGDASYTLYLVHTFPVSLLLTLGPVLALPTDMIILLAVAASLLLAWRSYELFEKPILRLLKRPSPADREVEGLT